MKINNKIFKGVTAVALFGSLVGASFYSLGRGIISYAEELEYREEIIAQTESFSQNETLQALLQEGGNSQMRTVQNNSFSAERDYGGVFLDEDKLLNICLVNNEYYLANCDYLSGEIYSDQEVKFVPVTYSLSELNELKEILAEKTDEFALKRVSVIQKENFIKIGLDDLTQSVIVNTFLNNNGYDIGMINYVEVGNPTNHATTVYNGNGVAAIAAGESVSVGSIGASAVKLVDGQYKKGIVTARHVLNIAATAEVYLHPAALYMGNFVGSNAPISTKIDAAFVQFNNQSSFNITYQCSANNGGTQASIDDKATSSMIIEGASVSKYGYTTNATAGIITDSSYDGILDITLLESGYDYIECDYVSDSGDSGGCVFIQTYNNATYTYTNYIVGIHRGGYDLDGEAYSYASKISNVESLLGITIITKKNYSTYS